MTESSTHVLELKGGFDSLWGKAFSPSNRNKCRKADRAGVVVSRENSESAAASDARLYESAAHAWGYGEPPHPRRLVSALTASPHVDLLIARLEQRVIGGAIVLKGTDDALCWSSSIDRDYRGVAPSNAIVRHAIRAACEECHSYSTSVQARGFQELRGSR